MALLARNTRAVVAKKITLWHSIIIKIETLNRHNATFGRWLPECGERGSIKSKDR